MATPTQHTKLPSSSAAPVWPTSMKVVSALVLGAAFTAWTFIQYVPDEQLASSTNSAPRTGQFVAEDPDAANDGGGGSGGAVISGGGGGAADDGGTGGSSGGGVAVGGAGGADGAVGSSDPTGGGKLECKAGQNGGSTDTGISGDKIRLAANVVLDGAGANFLDESPDGMEAVIRRINNKENGICGRTLELKTVNDSWDATRGRENIENFIAEGYFALPVMPSSEGLSAAIQAGIIEDAGIPVIGTDGMRKEQYDASGKASWVGPVATATVSQVRIMAKYAYDDSTIKARKFGIVYDKIYKFGVEGADAYEDYIKKLSGASLESKMAIAPGETAYPEADQFLGECGDCDLVVLLLEPETGKSWMASMGNPSGMTIMGAQPLFNDNFASGCGSVCNGLFVWTGYNPAIGPNTSKPDIGRFINDVKEVNPSADVTNQFLQGAYLGMEVFVETLKACSPNLTRDCVKAELDSMTYKTDMSSTLSWKPGDHFANIGARAYSIAYDGPNFTGFRDEQTGFINDPTPGQVPG